MATLQEIGLQGFAGTAPTPVLQRAINAYLVNDQLFNAMRFTNRGFTSNLGNIQVSGVYYEGTSEATFRALGEEYTPDNETPLTFTETLKNLGGSFNADVTNVRAFANNPGMVSNWVEQQTVQKINAIKNGFAKYFIQGDASKDAKQFNGLNAKISAGQVNKAPIDITDIDNKSLAIEKELNKMLVKVRPMRPNFILTTADGVATLNALNAYRHRAVDVIEVNGKQYNQWNGIPLIQLDNAFPTEDTSIGIPVVFVLFDEEYGINFTLPADGEVLYIRQPKFDRGEVVEKGSCEMLGTPIFGNPFAMAKCYLKETVE